MRASGSAFCRRRPARPCCDGLTSPRDALRAGRVGHGVRFVEDDDAGKRVALVVVLAAGEPGDDLVEA